MSDDVRKISSNVGLIWFTLLTFQIAFGLVCLGITLSRDRDAACATACAPAAGESRPVEGDPSHACYCSTANGWTRAVADFAKIRATVERREP